MASDFEWAAPHPELRKMCVLFQRDELRAPIRWQYRPLPSCLQKGPQCGLVALAMLSETPGEDTVATLLAHARRMGYTNHGEVFSCQDMLALAQHLLGKDSCQLYRGPLDAGHIKQFLMDGGRLLVPYDTDKDNSPGLHGGHKAHWCALCGAIDTGEQFFVIARHGKAMNVGIWALTDLAQSNQQLLEAAPDRHDLKLPLGGIAGPRGLNGQSVLVSLSSACNVTVIT